MAMHFITSHNPTVNTVDDSPATPGRVRVVIQPKVDRPARSMRLHEVLGTASNPRPPGRGLWWWWSRIGRASAWMVLALSALGAGLTVSLLTPPPMNNFTKSDIWLPVPLTPAAVEAVEIADATQVTVPASTSTSSPAETSSNSQSDFSVPSGLKTTRTTLGEAPPASTEVAASTSNDAGPVPPAAVTTSTVDDHGGQRDPGPTTTAVSSGSSSSGSAGNHSGK